MIRLQSVTVERWPVAGAFTISRGAKTHVDVVLCEVSDGVHVGRGEGTPVYYHGETAQGCTAAIQAGAVDPAAFDRQSLRTVMAPGAARNALDCALWDLEAQQQGAPVWELAGLAEPEPLATAFTISLDTPPAMQAAAQRAHGRGYKLLKCKLTGAGDEERISAVQVGAPCVPLIVDANESWGEIDIAARAHSFAALGVSLIEQPLPAGADAALAGVSSPIPLCADESCQSLADVQELADRYQAINIKLDKAGGLTEALDMAQVARQLGLKLMIGCMLGTSLGMAPAQLLAQGADWVDLDGALLLARDREGAPRCEAGLLLPNGFWGKSIALPGIST